jgi:hypothetical protein
MNKKNVWSFISNPLRLLVIAPKYLDKDTVNSLHSHFISVEIEVLNFRSSDQNYRHAINILLRYEVLRKVKFLVVEFFIVTLRGLVDGYRYFG